MAKTNKPEGTVSEQDAVLEEVGIVLPESPRVFKVEIPNCLLGEQYVLAHSEHEALDRYRGACGISKHSQPANVRVTTLDPNNLPADAHLFGEPGDAA